MRINENKRAYNKKWVKNSRKMKLRKDGKITNISASDSTQSKRVLIKCN